MKPTTPLLRSSHTEQTAAPALLRAVLLTVALVLGLGLTVFGPGNLTAQSPVPAQAADDASSPQAQARKAELITEVHPRYFSNYSNPLTQTPTLLLRFNDPIDLKAIATSAYFVDGDGLRLPVATSRPTIEQAQPLQRRSHESDDGSELAPYPPNHFVRIETIAPLPLDHYWRLVLPELLTSADQSHRSSKDRIINLGRIEPFTILGSRVGNPYDNDRYLDIRLSKRLHEAMNSEVLAQYITVTPQPAKMRITASGSLVRIHGDYVLDRNYRLAVKPGLVSYDETQTERSEDSIHRFIPADPFVSLPAFAAPQLSSGARTFDINAGNLDNLRVRVKQLDDKELIYALRGYEVYHDDRVIPFEMVPGRTIVDEHIASPAIFDEIQSVHLDWRAVLGDSTDDPNGATPAALYICAEGQSKISDDQRIFGAQSIIQLTDIGLAWKQDGNHTLVYAFSLAGGQPLANVALQLVDNEAETLRTATTDAHGLARLPRVDSIDGANWLLSRLGDDRHVMDVSLIDDNTIGLWRFAVNYSYRNQNEPGSDPFGRRTFLFTDRPVYKPGEEVYLKSLTRLTDFSSLLPASADQGSDARLRVYDAHHRNILDTRVVISDYGSLEHRFTLPGEGLGRYRIELDFNPQPTTNADGETETPRHRYDLTFDHYIQVAEYRPNTFEIQLSPPADTDAPADPAETDDRIDLPVAAHYYMGKPLSKARLLWHARMTPWQPQAKGLEHFSFLAPSEQSSSHSSSHEFELAEDGSGIIEIDLPTQGDQASPLQVEVNAEITDVNQQTVASSTDFVVHSAQYYVGLRVPDTSGRENQPVAVEVAAIDRDGQALSERSVAAELLIEKRVRYTTKVRSAGGSISTRSSHRYEAVDQHDLEVATSPFDDSTGTISGTVHSFTPSAAGTYRITVSSSDAAGNVSSASASYRVLGEDDRDWTYQDSVRLTLTPEKDHYQAGDTARLFIDTPILGHALVSIERNRVRESFVRPITRNRDVIELPIPADGAPNLFVSVLVIRGAADSPHQHPETAFRLGYTEIQVDDPSRELHIDIAPSQAEYEPGDAIDIVTTVHDADGLGLANTELTLYAVDEGVLSLTGHQTPDPSAVLHAPYELDVVTGQNLSTLLAEDPEQQYFNNKGYVVGGGGDGGGMAPERTRKNFKALAFWQGSLVTDSQGRAQVSFTAPDNLTEYRIIAVAAKDDRFASAEAAITINKPLIVEPSLPAFTNVGDHIDVRAVLHNNTETRLTLDVSLELDATAEFSADTLPRLIPTQFNPADRPAGITDNRPDTFSSRSRRIELSAGETSALTFPVRFVNVGTAKWKWRAVAANRSGLTDSVESKLEVGFPLPLLRESHHTVITPTSGDDRIDDILSRISPELLKGRGRVQVTISNSRLIEAQDALDYLLKYPYGCVEQTTSSTLPWLSTQNLRGALPALKKTDVEIADAIEAGARRLLTMQTHDGGLGYWPGATEPVLWGSAYGGMAIALAHRSGTDLPAEQLDALWTYLSKNLRSVGDGKKTQTTSRGNPYDLSQRCLALYTLALAGKAEPAYHDVLFQRRLELPTEARALLALAMIESANDADKVDRGRVGELLEDDPQAPKSGVTWYGEPYAYATRILAWTRLDKHSESANQLIGELLTLRHGERAWGSTYSNAWPILALSAHTQATLPDLAAARIEISLNDDRRDLDFTTGLASGEAEFHFDGDLSDARLTVRNADRSGSMPLYAHIEIESLPDITDVEAVNHGFDISRRYRKIAANGDLSPATDLSVGDLVLITLDMTVPDKQSYLAIDDPLPAIFEAVNPEFKTQASQDAPRPADWRKRLYTHHNELRTDRALFFANYLYRGGDYQIQYLARVVANGEATAPPAKIEAMYEPQRYGLSASERVSARALIPDIDEERAKQGRVATR